MERDIPWDMSHNATLPYHIFTCVLYGLVKCKQASPFLHDLLKCFNCFVKDFTCVYGQYQADFMLTVRLRLLS